MVHQLAAHGTCRPCACRLLMQSMSQTRVGVATFFHRQAASTHRQAATVAGRLAECIVTAVELTKNTTAALLVRLWPAVSKYTLCLPCVCVAGVGAACKSSRDGGLRSTELTALSADGILVGCVLCKGEHANSAGATASGIWRALAGCLHLGAAHGRGSGSHRGIIHDGSNTWQHPAGYCIPFCKDNSAGATI